MTNTNELLYQAMLPLVNQKTCLQLDGYRELLTRNMICAGPKEGGTDACSVRYYFLPTVLIMSILKQGDSGGPLQCRIDGTWTIVGIISDGPPSCHSHPNQPGRYTRVQNYLRWIYNTVYQDWRSESRSGPPRIPPGQLKKLLWRRQ
ncbi:hypothetical protein ScPMuIL_004970 [Solemya velum]